jgi:chromosome segregation ATPase
MTAQAVTAQKQARGATVSEDNNEDRIGRVEDQLIQVEGRLGRVEDQMVKVEGRLGRVEDQLIKVDGRLERVDDRLARVESDVVELKGQVKSLAAGLTDSRIEASKEFGAVRAEFKQECGAIRAEFKEDLGALRAEMKEGFGVLQTSIERSKVWMITTGVAAVLAIAGIVGFKTH